MGELIRYSVIQDKFPREIVLLRGSGCAWKKCTFCDYHSDFSLDIKANQKLNFDALSHVTGEYKHLDVINSGSFCELDDGTINEIERICRLYDIQILHFECHWLYRNKIESLRQKFKGITLKVRIGIETFDINYRESIMQKGIGNISPKEIAQYFDECCLLFGLNGQTVQSMQNDIETALTYFERASINIMVENTTSIKPNKEVINQFLTHIYPIYKDNTRLDILINNTDFGVGGET